jgi:hypothetical protein
MTAFVVTVMTTSAQALVIDDFTDSSSLETEFLGSPHDDVSTTDTIPLGSIIGGVRHSSLSSGSLSIIAKLETKTGTGISNSVMAFSSIASTTGYAGNLGLFYDGGGAGFGGGAGADFTIGGDNAFEIIVNRTVNVSPDLQFEVHDADGEIGLVTSIAFPDLPLGGSPESILIPYTAFASQIDFDKITNVGLIHPFWSEPGTAVGLEIVSINTTYVPVPEPTTFAGLSFMGLLVLTRRRRFSI